MKIARIDLDAVHVNHRGDWIFVHVRTDDGLAGLGELRAGTGYQGRVRAVRKLGASLEGKDPGAIEQIVAEVVDGEPDQDGLCALSAI